MPSITHRIVGAMDGPRPAQVLAWVNRQLASRGRKTLAHLPPGGAPEALPDYRFYIPVFEFWGGRGLHQGRLPKVVIEHLDWLRRTSP
jgi:hypothetical protein